MVENLEEHLQTQIYQSFANLSNDKSENITNSSFKKENVEFTFKKLLSGSNKAKEIEKEKDNNIYSKNDENIKQSGHFFNGNNNESKYIKLINEQKEKNNIIKPLFKFITKEKMEIQNLKMKKINFVRKNLVILNKTKTNLLYKNYFKKNIKFKSNISKSNNTSNITTINNNKCIFNILTKSPVQTFLEISHESNNENNEDRKINENKENINTQNININTYKKNVKIKNKIYNTNIILNKSSKRKNIETVKSRNNPKHKKIKYEKNISFDLLKNEYKELKQKINENKIKNKVNKLNKGYKTDISNNNKVKSDKKLTFNINKNNRNNNKNNYNNSFFNSISCFKNKIKQNTIKKIKSSKFSLINDNNYRKDSFNLNSHRRLLSISLKSNK